VQVTLETAVSSGHGELNSPIWRCSPRPARSSCGRSSEPATRAAPGQFVRVRLLGLKRPSAILVRIGPCSRPERAFVYVVGDSNKVTARNVVATPGTRMWRIEQGLEAGTG